MLWLLSSFVHILFTRRQLRLDLHLQENLSPLPHRGLFFVRRSEICLLILHLSSHGDLNPVSQA